MPETENLQETTGLEEQAAALPAQRGADAVVNPAGGVAVAEAVELSPAAIESSSPFVGQWNELVTTTNWEKGRIISAWRDELEKSGAAVTEYSDEAWARLVGSVTSQHVGRLRRVHARFADCQAQYPGLYWSHFQAALDWSDAEMWLEGAITNSWSVSQMRGARWEAVGAPDGVKPADEEIVAAEIDEDAYQSFNEPAPAEASAPSESAERSDDQERDEQRQHEADEDDDRSARESASADDAPVAEATPRVRPFADLAELPDDVAEAFEQFKLVILSHKLTGWEAISRDEMLGALESLKALALAPSDDA